MITEVSLSGENRGAGSESEYSMTEEFVVQQCKAHRGYITPELNEKLYLHHFGFTRIENLDPYTGCKVLYLTHNAISDLSPLKALVCLDSLYVSNNAIRSLESLPELPQLRLLDVSHNYLADVAGLRATKTPCLETLLASHNIIQSLDGLGCMSLLTSLDVSHNKLTDLDAVEKSLGPLMGTLSTLVLSGNKAVHSRSNYRKTLIHNFASLCFLDEYPVFVEERRKAEAFAAGGVEAELEMAKNIRDEGEEARQQQFSFFSAEQQAARLRHVPGVQPATTQYYEDHKLDDVYIPCATQIV